MTKADKRRIQQIARACGWTVESWDRDVAVVLEEDGSLETFTPEADWNDLMRAVERLGLTVHCEQCPNRSWEVIIFYRCPSEKYYHQSLHRAAFLAVADAAAMILKERKAKP